MKKTPLIIGAVVLVLLLVLVSLPFLINANQFRPRIESELSAALGRPVKVGNLSLNIFGGAVSADDLTIADDPKFSTAPFVQAHSLKMSVELSPLIFSHQLNVRGLVIDQPSIALIQSPDGKWNFSSVGAAKPANPAPAPSASNAQPMALSAQLIQVTNGRLTVSQLDGRTKPLSLQDVNLEIHGFNPAASFPFTLAGKLASGGDIHLDGKAGPINSSDAAATPVQVALKANNLPLAASGFVDPASSIDGLLSIDGTAASTGQQISWNGRVQAEKLRLVKNGQPDTRPVAFDFTLVHNLGTHSGSLSRGDVHVGNALAHLTGTYGEQARVTNLKMHLAGAGMPVPDLLTLLPPLDVQLPAGSSLQGGVATIDADVAGPLTAPVADIALNVTNTKLAGFNLGRELSFIQALGGVNAGPDTVIQAASSRIHGTPESQTIRDIHLVVPAIGELQGEGTISSNHALDFKMTAIVSGPGNILAALGQKSGKASIPFFIQGTSANPSFKPDVRGIANEQVKRFETNPQIKNAIDSLGGLFGGSKK